jgi:hypothetical protein
LPLELQDEDPIVVPIEKYEVTSPGEVLVRFGSSPLFTSLTIDMPDRLVQGSSVAIYAKLIDENGKPIQNMPVHFYLYSGVKGILIGSGRTDSGGVVGINYIFNLPGNFSVKAVYTGDDDHYGSVAMDDISVSINYGRVFYSMVTAYVVLALILVIVWRRIM